MLDIAHRTPTRLSRLLTALGCGLVLVAVTGCGSTSKVSTQSGAASIATAQVTTAARGRTSTPVSSSPTSSPTASATVAATRPSTAAPTASRVSRIGPSNLSAYGKSLRRLSATFDRASSQFSALADGAVPAEVGAEAPTFAAAAATFASSLARLQAPATATADLTALEAQLKRLSYELTTLADATETGHISAAKTQLAAATRTDATIAALNASVTASAPS